MVCVQESNHSREEDILKEHVNELREKLRNLHTQQEEEIEHFKQREDNLHKTMLVLQEKHKQEVSNELTHWTYFALLF